MDSARSRLEEVEYERAAGDFVRYRPEEVDDAVAALVRTVVAEGWSGAEEFRRGLSPDGVDTLGLFARRRILLARRASSMSAVYEFLDAVALLPSPEDVAWDSWVKAGLFVARSLGGDAQMLNRQFEDVAGTALLRTGPDGRLTLTAYGRLLARDDRPALETTTQTREKDPGHAP